MPSRKSTDLAETRSWAILENGTEGKTVNWHYSLFLKHHHELNAWKTPTEKILIPREEEEYYDHLAPDTWWG